MNETEFSGDDHQDSAVPRDSRLDEETVTADAMKIEDAEERTAFLDRVCANDEKLRAGVDELMGLIGDNDRLLVQETVAEGRTIVEDSSPEFLAPSDLADSMGRLDNYEVWEVLGRGGMGIVLRALDTKLKRTVAVKVLAPFLAEHEKARKRFLREAQAAAAVSHPNVVTIHAVEEASRLPYLVMECVDGETLTQRIQREGKLKSAEIVRIGLQIARGLAAAHEQRLIHRDIKPCNILLERDGESVKITDFGLARAVDDIAITRTGEVNGTPQFMSPEQAEGARVDHRSDLFSLGSVLYAMCSGSSPFRADSPVAILRRVCDFKPRPIREVNPDISDPLAKVVNKLLEKNPNDRFQSSAAVAESLEQQLAELRAPARESKPEPKPEPKPDPKPDPKPGTVRQYTKPGEVRRYQRSEAPIVERPRTSAMKSSSMRRWLPFVLILLLAVGPAVAELAGYSIFPSSWYANEGGDFGGQAAASGATSPEERLRSAEWKWSVPRKLEVSVNGRGQNDEPFLAADGLALLFRSGRSGGSGSNDLWICTRGTTSDPWSAPRNLGTNVNSEHSESSPFLSRDGLTLLFASSHPGGEGDLDLWTCSRDSIKAEWSQAKPLENSINTSAAETDPCLSFDGLTLLFARNNPRDRQNSDIWVSRRSTLTAPWTPAVKLSLAVNTSAAEGGPHLSPDGQTLLYHSGSDASIWMARRRSRTAEWSQGEKIFEMKTGGAAHPHLTDDVERLFFRSTGDARSFDLWVVNRVPAGRAAESPSMK